MNPRRRSFIRKIIYVACLLPLVTVALPWLGSPSTLDTETAKGSPGGWLARMRAANDLEQVYYGKIDPASETLRLVTLGMRGVAADVLWIKNIEYQKKKDWTNVSATLNQIIKLQPNFIDVWRHQGWNLSYNCSAEFDDYHERYRWVIKGIEFLKLGTTYNQLEPRLHRDIGWFLSQKIGRSDEHKQFRRLFKEDDDFNGALPKDKRDNWLVGKGWFRKAEALIDNNEKVSTRGMNPVVFRSEGPMCQMNYGAALEKDGVFGERARRAWQEATKDWATFGQFGIPSASGRIIRLGEYDRLMNDRQGLLDELDRLAPGIREKLREERLAHLTDEQRAALDTPPAQRTAEQGTPAAEAEALLVIEPREIARNRDVPRENRDKAKDVLARIDQLDEQLRLTQSYRGIVNYEYWQRRAEIEQKEEMLTARELVFQGSKALAEGNLPGAIDAFAMGSVHWANVLGEYPMMLTDSSTGDDLEELLEEYGKALDQRDELFPANFPLAGIIRVQVLDDPKRFQIAGSTKKAAEAERSGDWAAASTFYAQALRNWMQVIEDFPSLEQRSDPFSCAEIMTTIAKYVQVLRKLKQPVPADFSLHRFVRIHLEHDPQTRDAQRLIEKAQTAADQRDLAAAVKAYEEGFTRWRAVLDRYPTAVADSTLGDELIALVEEYRQLLKQQHQELPKDFVLQDIVDRYGQPTGE